MDIKHLNLDHFRGNDATLRRQFVDDLGTSFSNTGFAIVGNHDLSDEAQVELYDEIANFFALPTSTKVQYARDDLHGQRGYNGFKSEQAKGEKVADLKEFWHHGQAPSPDREPLAGQYENIDVKECPRFTPTLEQTYRALERSAIDILSAIALFLDLDEQYFDSKVDGGLSILRALHYPPITEEPDSAVRAAAHEDINLITLLIGASASGLELKTRSGEWYPVVAPEGHLVVNVGDMLQRLTNRKLVSTTHRVVNPPRENWGESRFSVPFFLHPRGETDLSCLASCISESNPKAFDDCTAEEYLAERLREIRAKS